MLEHPPFISKRPLSEKVLNRLEHAILLGESYSVVRLSQCGTVICKSADAEKAAQAMEEVLGESDLTIRRRIADIAARFAFPSIVPGEAVPTVDMRNY